ncbi:NAD-dependent epimerase/dehydratase family protein [bacterium]|nr:NAD-dependent epimerase/dehydratase family protein [bacterium]
MPVALITGASGLVGSECVVHFAGRGFAVTGVDNNMRMDFFGAGGDTRRRGRELLATVPDYTLVERDIRDRAKVDDLVAAIRPDLIVHAAAQPSHDLAKDRPFDDFEVNALGTLNLLEATRRHAPKAAFCFLSTNKVYGDGPNRVPLVELETRWEYERDEDRAGIREDFPIDHCTHSLFGASKAAADLMVQEYGRYFGMNTVCFRGGCLTGPHHAGVELHGFLAYLVKVAATGGTYRIFGYKGKQVRDNLHALDVCRAIEAYFEAPRPAAVYNLGGGRGNSISLLEAIEKAEDVTGKKMNTEYVETARVGDHICYISDLSRLRADYPGWDVTVGLDRIFEEIHADLTRRIED